jgi:predicted dehydrogenase
MSYKILIVGAGQLGSRYLQGLAKVARQLDIFISDVSSDSLARAEARWHEVANSDSQHSLRFGLGLSHLPQEIDVAIVATGADVRAQVVSAISVHCTVRYWILEKVLAQSLQEMDQIQAAIRNNRKAWVNTLRRTVDWHKEIKANLGQSGPFSIAVEGGNWSLASSAIHFLDMLAWISNEQLLSIETQQLDHWHESKRAGFWEIYGTLVAQFSGDSVATLTCQKLNQPYIIWLRAGQDEWKINESLGIAENGAGLVVRGKLSYQSEITARIIESILETGQCELPSLKVSAELHRPLIHGLLEHWNKNMPNKGSRVPIT